MTRELPQAADTLDAHVLRAALPRPAARRIERLDVFAEIDSTSAYLLRNPPPPRGRLSACIADHQTAGRGRLGRRWTAPPGAALTLSVGWLFAAPPRELSALPLAVGVVARRALRRSTGVAIELKWPNDLVWDGRKLGGILVDSVSAHGACHVVVGIGVNVAMPARVLEGLSDWQRGAVDLARAARGAPPRRAALAAALLGDLCDLLERFAAEGAADYLQEFAQADTLDGHRVSVTQADDDRWSGIARGVEGDGALVVETADGVRRRVVAGDVSIRYAP